MKLYIQKLIGVVIFMASFWLPFYLGHKFVHLGEWYTVPLIITLIILYCVLAYPALHLVLRKD